jgi:hypothetical protein
MVFVDFVFSLTFTLLFVVLFAILFQYRGPWNSVLWFFVVVLLATWAGGVWLTPVGPAVGGFYWMPFLMAGLIVSLLLAAATIPAKEESTVELVDEKARRRQRWAVGTALGIFFWVLMLLLAGAIFLRYVT